MALGVWWPRKRVERRGCDAGASEMMSYPLPSPDHRQPSLPFWSAAAASSSHSRSDGWLIALLAAEDRSSGGVYSKRRRQWRPVGRKHNIAVEPSNTTRFCSSGIAKHVVLVLPPNKKLCELFMIHSNVLLAGQSDIGQQTRNLSNESNTRFVQHPPTLRCTKSSGKQLLNISGRELISFLVCRRSLWEGQSREGRCCAPMLAAKDAHVKHSRVLLRSYALSFPCVIIQSDDW